MPVLINPYRFAAALTYDQEVAADAPFRYWKLEEPSGSTATDSSGNAGNGTYVGSPTLAQTGLVAGDAGTSVLFPGAASTRVTVVDSAGYDSTSVTVECWFKSTDATSAPNMVSRDGGGSGNRSFQFRLNAGAPSFVYFRGGSTGGANEIVDPSTRNDGSPHHMAATVDDATKTATLYVDGAQVDQDVGFSGGSLSPSTFLLIGTRTSVANPYAGNLQKVAYYTTALSAARVLAHYNAGIA
jgi:hypothetical protein